MKHHHPEVWGKIANSSLDWVTHCVSVVWTSIQSAYYMCANRRVSLGSVSMLLKTISFHHFQIYQRIHANWWLSICDVVLQNKLSIFSKIDCKGKFYGFDKSLIGPMFEWLGDILINMIYGFLLCSTSRTLRITLNTSFPKVFLNW